MWGRGRDVVADVPVSSMFAAEISSLTAASLSKHPYKDNLRKIVDELGRASAVAQSLKSPITSYERTLDSDHRLYMAVDLDADDGRGAVVGFLKLGKKRLFVTDGSEPALPVDVECVLDFFINSEYQRRGWGKHLFHTVTELENIDPQNMAYDRPSEKLIAFLAKHYRLTDVVEQPNRYVLYGNFFKNASPKYAAQGRCSTASKLRPNSGGYLMRRY